MTDETGVSMRPQPMIAVADVEAASHWYQHVLAASSGHGGAEYEQLLVDGRLIMQLHRLEIGHHHGTIRRSRAACRKRRSPMVRNS